MTRFLWVVQDAARPGGVEKVVRVLDSGLGERGIPSEVLSWYGPGPHLAPGRGGWLRATVERGLLRRRAATTAAAKIRERLRTCPDLVVLLDPGSFDVAYRLRGYPRWGIHVHWDPDVLLRPWRHLGGEGIPGPLLWVAKLRSLFQGREQRGLLRHAPFLITLTPTHTVKMRALQREVHEIPNPVAAHQRVRPPRDSEGPILVGFVGRLSWEKGPDLFADALNLLGDTPVPVRAVVAGSGPMESDIARKLAEANLEGWQMLGWLDDPADTLARLDVLVLPSRAEALGLVLVEALAAGCSVVAADAGGGVRDTLGQGRLGRLVPVEQPEALAAALTEAIADVCLGVRSDRADVADLVARHEPGKVIDLWIALASELAPPRGPKGVE